jgi:hypothetical protein
MNARTRTLGSTALITLIAAFLAGCERTVTPQTTRTGDGGTYATTLSAPPAPSLVGTPIQETPATHALAVAPPAPEEPTARDTTANRPMATIDPHKNAAEQPLAGQVNSFMSDSQQAGRNEASSAVPIDGKPVEQAKPTT